MITYGTGKIVEYSGSVKQSGGKIADRAGVMEDSYFIKKV